MVTRISQYCRQKYSKDEKLRVRSRILALKQSGKSYAEILESLNVEGFQTPHKKPVNMDWLRNQIWRMRKADYDLPKDNLYVGRKSRTVNAVLSDKRLSDAKKVALLKTYFGVCDE